MQEEDTVFAHIARYRNEMVSFVRVDEGISDLLLIPPVKGNDYILNRDITVYMKPHALISLSFLREFVGKSDFYFRIFYRHLDVTLTVREILIPMLRYFFFVGAGRKLLTLFLTLHRKREVTAFSLFLAYYTAKEDRELRNYVTFIEKAYRERLQEIEKKELFFYGEIGEFQKHSGIFTFRILKETLETIKKKYHLEKFISFYNYVFLQYLFAGNYYVAFRLYKKTREFLHFPLLHDFQNGLGLRLAIVFLSHKKFFFLSQEKFLDEFAALPEDEVLGKISGYLLYPKRSIEEYISCLVFDCHIPCFLGFLHEIFDDLLLYLLREHQDLDIGKYREPVWKVMDFEKFIFSNYLKDREIQWIFFSEISEKRSEMKATDGDLPLRFFFRLLEKYEEKLSFYLYLDPYVKGLTGIKLENTDLKKAKALYLSSNHPVLILRYGKIKRIENPSSTNLKEKSLLKSINDFFESYRKNGNEYAG